MEYRTGLGYDIHRFAKNRKLILGGVEIKHEMGLDGHSDADVLLHAVCDALLGALGKGDIGEHFPNTDKKYKDVSSLALLEKVYRLVQEEGFSVSFIDTVIQAEEPNIKKYKPEIRANIASRTGLDVERVNVKATTQEGLGAIGRKEGIAAFAVATIVRTKQ